MSTSEPIRLDARLEVSDDRLSGEVIRQGSPPISFSGWIGFLGAVERACALPEPRPPQNTNPADSVGGSNRHDT
jgi:hypothetical protein